MCNTKNKLLAIWKQDESNLQNRILYNKYRNKTNKYINYIKNKHIKSQIIANFKNPKKVWDIVNKLCGKLTKSIDEILLNKFKMPAKLISNKFATELQKNIEQTCTSCSTSILKTNTYINEPNVCFRLGKANQYTISTIINKLNENKSAGWDNISAKYIKHVKGKITPIITHLINQSIETCNYPDLLKIGVIRPIHKKGSYDNPNNYRPITILSSIDKVIERYIGDTLSKYLAQNKIINCKQFGFQKNKSTSQLLAKFTNEVNLHLNERRHVIAVFIDFSKAFDVLNYNILFSKLEQNGIQGPALNWFKNYHTNRHTVVKVAGEYSNKVFTSQGTAQGSIIGPSEYLLYVNDMCNIFKDCSIYQFADDTCLITAHNNLFKAQELMQHNYDQLCKWAHDVGLVINTQKTKLMHIHSSYIKYDTQPTIIAHEHSCLHQQYTKCNCNPLEMVDQHMYLGLIIDSKFNWRPHVIHICNKLRAILCNLTILKHKIPYQTLRLLYLALANSIINYGLSSYGRTFKTYIQEIYKIQLKILKAIVPSYVKQLYRHDDSNLFKYCNTLNVYEETKLAVICEEWEQLSKLKKYSRPVTLRKLNRLPTYKIPTYKNIYGKRTWEYLLPSLLNELPLTILNIVKYYKVKIAKRTLKEFLIK
ncbi:unnamed protein product [Parnassius mnemosyne]|uniref:Reverse transcriptase domain-containing protein n=1 Tax=Parnassius mnemosyne TaxID=213953 RepID=A0AAV1LPD4_9NEOP